MKTVRPVSERISEVGGAVGGRAKKIQDRDLSTRYAAAMLVYQVADALARGDRRTLELADRAFQMLAFGGR